MKVSTTVQIAAAGILSMASMASAQSACAVTCFTNVITEHPPLDCKEANMYLCFCKMSSLQNYFRECAAKDCPSTAEQTIQYGYDICKDMGSPIVDAPASSSKAEEPAAQPTTKAAEEAKPTTKAEEAPKGTTTKAAEAAATTKAATSAAAPTKSSGSAAPSGEKPASSPTPTTVPVSGANAMAVSGLVAAAAAAVAVFQL